MKQYRLQYASPADEVRQSMSAALRTRFDTGMVRLTADPYGLGSTPLKGDEDRREATVSGVVIRYYVSRSVLMVTVVRVVYL